MPDGDSGDMAKLVEAIAKVLVDTPDQVNVLAHHSDQYTGLELHVAAGELGRVIGKQGRTARSIRTILGVAGLKLNKHFTLEIRE